MRKFDVIKKPVLTEKSYKHMEGKRKYVFDVAIDSNKSEIKKVFEELFEVKVDSVNVQRKEAKIKRTGKWLGRKNHRKIAIITLKKGEKLEVMDNDNQSNISDSVNENLEKIKSAEVVENKTNDSNDVIKSSSNEIENKNPEIKDKKSSTKKDTKVEKEDDK